MTRPTPDELTALAARVVEMAQNPADRRALVAGIVAAADIEHGSDRRLALVALAHTIATDPTR